MLTEVEMYLITRLDHIKEMLGFVVLIYCAVTPVLSLIYALAIHAEFGFVEGYKKSIRVVAFASASMTLGLLLWTAQCLIPTTSEMYMIKITPVVANKTSEVGEEASSLIKEWLQRLRGKDVDEDS